MYGCQVFNYNFRNYQMQSCLLTFLLTPLASVFVLVFTITKLYLDHETPYKDIIFVK